MVVTTGPSNWSNASNYQLHFRTIQSFAASPEDDGKQKFTADEDGEIQTTDVEPASKKRKSLIDKKDWTNAYYKRVGTIIPKCQELTEVTVCSDNYCLSRDTRIGEFKVLSV
ncbi:hypothetical protein BU17DRAFT_64276 [Hysterangium stoloniferum]|nr:hypothetical protein BU17DRAFT_64276 [Hysterangium stoloniferum]